MSLRRRRARKFPCARCWCGTRADPGNFPDTTPDKPYLTDYSAQDGGKISRRSSAGLTLDYKLTRNDTVSLAFQYAFSDKRRDSTRYYSFSKSNPEYFTVDLNNSYRQLLNKSQRAAEVISSGYFRGDAAFFDRRLMLVGGVRAEQTNVSGEGPPTEPTRAYRSREDVGALVTFGEKGTF